MARKRLPEGTAAAQYGEQIALANRCILASGPAKRVAGLAWRSAATWRNEDAASDGNAAAIPVRRVRARRWRHGDNVDGLGDPGTVQGPDRQGCVVAERRKDVLRIPVDGNVR